MDEATTPQPKGNLDVHIVHKPKRYQAFTRVSIYSIDTSRKTTGKPREMKCKLETGASVNVMPLAAYKLINPSEFDKNNKPKGGFSQDRTTLRGYSGNVIQQYGTILGNVISHCRDPGTHSARSQHNEEVWAVYKTSQDQHRDS